ncbi:MAG: hypothetical protein OXC60_03410 [Litoreibacter sp.]|nr:hypothetical protein [Litoreibacter sp.]
MTRYEELLRLTLEHAYFGAEAFPMEVKPADPQGFARAGLLLRQQGKTVSVIGESGGAGQPERVELLVIPAGPDVLEATLGADWHAVPQLQVPLDMERITLDDAVAENAPAQPRKPILCQLSVSLAPLGTREVTVAFNAVEALWAYHVIGSAETAEFSIFDPEGAVSFEPLDFETLPDGRIAHVLRSTTPLAARARPTHRFSLQEPGPFGLKTLIPVLPAGGISFRSATGLRPAHPFQTNIYINLN